MSTISFLILSILFEIISYRLIRLSSPNLNNIIGIGAVVLYVNVIALVVPTTDMQIAAVLCNVSIIIIIKNKKLQ